MCVCVCVGGRGWGGEAGGGEGCVRYTVFHAVHPSVPRLRFDFCAGVSNKHCLLTFLVIFSCC